MVPASNAGPARPGAETVRFTPGLAALAYIVAWIIAWSAGGFAFGVSVQAETGLPWGVAFLAWSRLAATAFLLGLLSLLGWSWISSPRGIRPHLQLLILSVCLGGSLGVMLVFSLLVLAGPGTPLELVPGLTKQDNALADT